MIWINIGAHHYQINSFHRKEISIENCTNLTNNTITSNMTNTVIEQVTTYKNIDNKPEINTYLFYSKSGLENIFFLYKLSYLYYSLFGTLITMLVAIIVSHFTRPDKVENINPLLVAPFLRSYVQNKINSE